MLLQGQLKLWEAGQEDDMVWGRKIHQTGQQWHRTAHYNGGVTLYKKKPEEKEIVLSPDFIYVDDKGFFYPTW